MYFLKKWLPKNCLEQFFSRLCTATAAKSLQANMDGGK